MAHSGWAVVEAIADRLLVELDGYEELLAQTLAADRHPLLQFAVAGQADRVQRCAQGLPRTAIPVANFLVSRVDLARALQVGTEADELLRAALGDHLGAVHSLRRACERVKAAARSGHAGSGEGADSAHELLELQNTRRFPL